MYQYNGTHPETREEGHEVDGILAFVASDPDLLR